MNDRKFWALVVAAEGFVERRGTRVTRVVRPAGLLVLHASTPQHTHDSQETFLRESR